MNLITPRRHIRAVSSVICLYAAAWGVFTLVASRNRYEWMLNDPAFIADGGNYCTLPLDNNANDLIIATALALLPVLLVAAVRQIQASQSQSNSAQSTAPQKAPQGSSPKRLHWSIYLSAILIALWACKWFIFAPQCPQPIS